MQDKDLNNSELDALFTRARTNSPEILDDGFTERVMQQLPAQPQSNTLSTPRWAPAWPDLVGLTIGVTACVSLTNPQHAVLWLSNLVLPEQLVVSAMTLLAATTAMAVLAASAWWSLEGRRD